MPGENLRKLHLFVGLAGVIAFVLTGQYMHWELNHLRGMADGPRLFYRTTHLYLMWASVLNLVLGCFLVRPQSSLNRGLQLLASIAVLVAPILICASFFLDSFNAELRRPMARYACFLAFGGVLGLLLSWFLSGTRRRTANNPDPA